MAGCYECKKVFFDEDDQECYCRAKEWQLIEPEDYEKAPDWCPEKDKGGKNSD